MVGKRLAAQNKGGKGHRRCCSPFLSRRKGKEKAKIRPGTRAQRGLGYRAEHYDLQLKWSLMKSLLVLFLLCALADFGQKIFSDQGAKNPGGDCNEQKSYSPA
ncbi:hypothetical protein AB3S75_047564 [Citrus x aurantiifolia]